jgi:hypothetical protein
MLNVVNCSFGKLLLSKNKIFYVFLNNTARNNKFYVESPRVRLLKAYKNKQFFK